MKNEEVSRYVMSVGGSAFRRAHQRHFAIDCDWDYKNKGSYSKGFRASRRIYV